MLTRITMKKLSRGPVLAGAGATLLLAGFVGGITTTAQADSPVCGQTSTNIVGTYHAQNMYFTLDADGTGTYGAYAKDELEKLPLKWRIDDSATVVNFEEGDLVLIPGCAGKKVKPETLIGGTASDATWVLHRNA